jgi:hypothetical protein
MVVSSFVHDAIHIGELAEMGPELASSTDRLPNVLVYWNLPSREVARRTTPAMSCGPQAASNFPSMLVTEFVVVGIG